jgi:hypothetical protein
MQLLAGALLVLSLTVAVWLSRRQGLRGPRRQLWLAACATVGLPALVALRLSYADREVVMATAVGTAPVAA